MLRLTIFNLTKNGFVKPGTLANNLHDAKKSLGNLFGQNSLSTTQFSTSIQT